MSSRGSQDDFFQNVLNGDAFLYEDSIALDSTRKIFGNKKIRTETDRKYRI